MWLDLVGFGWLWLDLVEFSHKNAHQSNKSTDKIAQSNASIRMAVGQWWDDTKGAQNLNNTCLICNLDICMRARVCVSV